MVLAEIAQWQEYSGALIAAFLFWLLVSYIAKKKGFFQLSQQQIPPIPLFSVVGGFITYLIASFVIAPFVVLAIYYIQQGSVDLKYLTEKPWWAAVILTIVFVVMVIYMLLMKRDQLRAIFWGNKTPGFLQVIKQLGWGIASWAVSYPAVILGGLIASLISMALWGHSGVNQMAVQYLLKTFQYPWLLVFTIILMIVIVPITEEFLFRGLLQTWLKRFCGRLGAIAIASLIFAFAHFAPSQGTGNLELLVSLFILACFLGFIYERQQSLIASIGMHAFFNGFSILLLIISG